jgi:hypothetical protein
MLALIKDKSSKTGIVVKVQKIAASDLPGNGSDGGVRRHYRCLLAKPGRVLHADLTIGSDRVVSIADLFRLLSMDTKGREFLKGFRKSGRQLHAISIDEETNIRELMEVCPA